MNKCRKKLKMKFETFFRKKKDLAEMNENNWKYTLEGSKV
jgi:hypothetical protein